MRRLYMLWILGLIVALTMVAATACGDDDGEDREPTATTAGETPAATEPADGEEVPGVSDTEVLLGTHTSLTGPMAAYSVIPYFTLAYFNYVNDTEGGVHGRQITFRLADDAASPPAAVDLTRQLVEQDGVFAMFNALGTPNHLQVIDYLQERGVPDMFVATGAIEWVKDPSVRPLVFGSNPNYNGEGLVVGKYVSDNFAGGKYGIIYQNDDFGIDGATGVKLGVNETVELVDELPYELTDPDLFSQIDSLRAADADVVVVWATPLLLANAIKHARQDLGWDVPFAITAVSMNELTMLIAGAENIEGTVGPVATYMRYHNDQQGVARHKEILDSHGEGTAANSGAASVLTHYAQMVAELMVETLTRAGQDLTREGLIDAAESIEDWTCSVCLFPVTLGPDDHDPAQAVALGRYEGGEIIITDEAYSWEGVPVDELSLDTLEPIEVPADALVGP